MNEDLFAMLRHMDDSPIERKEYLIAPIPYVGSKSRSLDNLLPLLPYSDIWVDAFGGSGIVTLNRHASTLDVFNDRHAGITAFYRCIRDPKLLEALIQRLDLTIHGLEEYQWSFETWEHDPLDLVERAARWYYTVIYSFARLGRNFGRSLNINAQLSGAIREKLQYFQTIHERFKRVQVENADFRTIIKDYDSNATVFYFDPPYYGKNIYKHEFTKADHKELCDRIFDCKGFVALSGYDNPLYDKYPWDAVHKWKVKVSVTTKAVETDTSNVKRVGLDEAEECLWIKDFEE